MRKISYSSDLFLVRHSLLSCTWSKTWTPQSSLAPLSFLLSEKESPIVHGHCSQKSVIPQSLGSTVKHVSFLHTPVRLTNNFCPLLSSGEPVKEHRECFISHSQFPTSISENQLQVSGKTISHHLSQDKRANPTSGEQLLVYRLQYL